MLSSGGYSAPKIHDHTVSFGIKSRTGATVFDCCLHHQSFATSASITSGNSAGHFAIDSGGRITLTSTGQNNLLSSYTLGIQASNSAGTSTATYTINTEANALDVTTAAELTAAIDYCQSTSLSTDWKIYVKDGYTITPPTINGTVSFTGKSFSGTLSDANANKTVAQLESSYNRNATASITGGSVTITCRTQNAGKIVAALDLIGCDKWIFDGVQIARIEAGFENRNINSILLRSTASFPTLGTFIYKNCKIGDSTKTRPYWTQGISATSVDTLIVEDCTFDGVWTGVACATANRFVSRRNVYTPNRVEDAMVGYGNQLTAGNFKRSEITDVVVMPINVTGMTTFEDQQHSDCVQFNTAGETGSYEHFICWNYFGSRQGIFMEAPATGVNHRGVISRNFVMAYSPNGMCISRCVSPDTFKMQYNTIVKDTTLVDNGGNGNCRVIINYGSGQLLDHNILAALVDATPPGAQVLYVGDANIPATLQDGVSTFTHTNNAYVDHRTANTGANNSYPEWFTGPFTYVGSGNPGMQWSYRTDTAANFKADIDAVFTPKVGSPAEGKGHLAA